MTADSNILRTGSIGRRGSKTIGVALDYMVPFDDGFEAELRKNFDFECQALDLNLLTFYGRAVDDPQNAGHNAIFNLIHRHRVDGLIIVSATLAACCGRDGMQRFAARYRDFPICSLGVALDGVPSVILDNRPGMSAVVEHMLSEHHRRRVAFIGGHPDSPEAQLRELVYRSALENHRLPIDPELIATGNFTKTGGRLAMHAILNRGIVPDAVIAANDTMALGAIDVLRERGYHVPGDVPVTGFDDLKLARLSNPALTTVAQPFSAMAHASIHVLLEQIAGRSVPDCTLLPCELVIRRSCGCNPITRCDGNAVRSASRSAPSDWLHERFDAIKLALANILVRSDDDGLREADQILTALERALQGQSELLLSTLESLLESAGAGNDRYRALHDAILYLRRELRAVDTIALEATWCDAMSLIAMANTTAQVDHRLQLESDYTKIFVIGERASLALDLPSLGLELSSSLPAAGYHTVMLSRYPQGNTTELIPFVCVVEGQRRELPESPFPAHDLFPDEVLPPKTRRSMLVFPLAFEAQSIGVAVFEYIPKVTAYVLVRDQISAVLRGVLLHEEVLSKTMLHERSVQERLVAAQRLQTLSVLAGGVAHDLNNALGPLLALPDVIQQELLDFEAAHGIVPALAEDVASMKTATLRASHTIKDLLTLGRQGRTARYPLDLNVAVGGCLSGDTLRYFREINPQVRVVAELSRTAVIVRGSDAQLSRAITNLVRNAVEAMPGAGEVKIRVASVRVNEPIHGYEVVEPGDYAVIFVSDTGTGIAAVQIAQIFEPFFSSKRTGERSGTGLGLAIVRGVVKEHEGFVDVKSTVGVGTEFALYFPMVDETPRRSERVVVAKQQQATVMIVDDDPMQLRTGQRVLSRLGYTVETYELGRIAYEVFARARASGRSPCDLIILDLMLKDDWDGLELLEQIRQIFPDQRAIIASGHAPNEKLESVLERGVEWLAKPYTVKSLIRAVTSTLAGTSEPGKQIR